MLDDDDLDRELQKLEKEERDIAQRKQRAIAAHLQLLRV